MNNIFLQVSDFSSTMEIVNRIGLYNMYCLTEEHILLLIDNTLLQLTKVA